MQPEPIKLCECGCGEPAPIATGTITALGRVKGQPMRFVHGHNGRGTKRTPEQRARISASLQGRVFSPATRLKLSQAQTGEAHRGKNSRNWKGGRKVQKDGYVIIWTPDGYQFEHRVVMAREIGRALKPKEVVHHINEVRDDNRPKNLMLFASSAEHLLHHRELKLERESR